MLLDEVIARILEALDAKQHMRLGYSYPPLARTGGARAHKRWKTRRASGRA